MSIFRLQQFSINQNLSGMKVCSDSLLFGSIIPVAGAKNILDIGTGTGLLTLMLAQKISALDMQNSFGITSIEMTEAAAVEACDNFNNSPWARSIKLIHQDTQGFTQDWLDSANTGEYFDLIISNPPFFSNHKRTSCHNELRGLARHTDSLPYEELVFSISKLLSNTGRAYVLLPIISVDQVIEIAGVEGLWARQKVNISESKAHFPKVVMVEFVKSSDKAECADFCIESEKIIYKFNDEGQHTNEVQGYLSDFLLRYESKEKI